MEFAKNNKMLYSQVSAKEGIGIEAMFQKVAENVCTIKAKSQKAGGAGF